MEKITIAHILSKLPEKDCYKNWERKGKTESLDDKGVLNETKRESFMSALGKRDCP